MSGAGWAQTTQMSGQQSVPAQQPAPASGQAGAYSLQVKSQLVVLDVVVTNKKGAAVGGLTRDDFKVYENKVPQEIVSFEPAARPGAVTAAPVAIHSTEEL